MLVSQILKMKSGQGVITVAPGVSVAEAARLLADRRIGAVIVLRDGLTPLGILSERDIVRELGQSGAGCMTDTVDSLMTAKLVSCVPGDLTAAILQKMTDGRFRHMPVMDGDKMIGLISIGDVVKAMVEELRADKEALVGMIKGF